MRCIEQKFVKLSKCLPKKWFVMQKVFSKVLFKKPFTDSSSFECVKSCSNQIQVCGLGFWICLK